MADPNNLLIHDRRLCLMLICKAANTSIKWAIAEAMGLQQTHRTDLHWPTPNKMDAKHYRDACGYLTLSVVRHPLARLYSCWRDKVADPGRFHRPFARKYGSHVVPGMSFEAFAHFVAATPDGIADQHFRSMAWDLCDHNGALIPDCIAVECGRWWSDLRGRVFEHCGLDLGPERRENASRSGDWRSAYTPELRRLTAARYAADFAAFSFYASDQEIAA